MFEFILILLVIIWAFGLLGGVGNLIHIVLVLALFGLAYYFWKGKKT